MGCKYIKELSNYSKYKVKKVYKIRKSYGYVVFLYCESDRVVSQQHAGFSTIEEAEKDRTLKLAELLQNRYLIYGNICVQDYFEHWLDVFKKEVETYNTYDTYKSAVKNHIIPHWRNKQMKDLNCADVNRLYAILCDYSINVAKNVRCVLKNCFDLAVEEKAMYYNIASDIELPIRKSKKDKEVAKYHVRTIDEKKVLTIDQTMKLINAAKGTNIYIMLLFNAFLGLRPSEIIAVKYSNIDFVTQTLHVNKQLGKDIKDLNKGKDNRSSTKQEIRVKTRSSKRGTHIPDFVFLAILEEKKKYEENRIKYKDKHTNWGYICCDRYGNPRCRNYHYEEFKKLLRDNNLPDIAWRNLRATCATINMELGATLKTTSKRLGHAKEIVTADHYVDRKRLAVRKIKKLDEYIESLYGIDTANKRIAKIDIDKFLC